MITYKFAYPHEVERTILHCIFQSKLLLITHYFLCRDCALPVHSFGVRRTLPYTFLIFTSGNTHFRFSKKARAEDRDRSVTTASPTTIPTWWWAKILSPQSGARSSHSHSRMYDVLLWHIKTYHKCFLRMRTIYVCRNLVLLVF